MPVSDSSEIGSPIGKVYSGHHSQHDEWSSLN